MASLQTRHVVPADTILLLVTTLESNEPCLRVTGTLPDILLEAKLLDTPKIFPLDDP